MIPPSEGDVLSVLSSLLVGQRSDSGVNVLATRRLVGASLRVVSAGSTFLLRLLAFYVLMDEEASSFASYIFILNLVKSFKQHPVFSFEECVRRSMHVYAFAVFYFSSTGLTKYEGIQARRYDEPPRPRGQ